MDESFASFVLQAICLRNGYYYACFQITVLTLNRNERFWIKIISQNLYFIVLSQKTSALQFFSLSELIKRVVIF